MFRILGEPSNNRRQRPSLHQTQSPPETSLPPAYSTVIVDNANHPDESVTDASMQSEIGPRVLYNSHTHRNHTLELHRRTTSADLTPAQRAQTLTARDVAQLLRPSIQAPFQRASSLGACVDQAMRDCLLRSLSRSAENLVLNAAPLGDSTAIVIRSSYSDDEQTKTSVI